MSGPKTGRLKSRLSCVLGAAALFIICVWLILPRYPKSVSELIGSYVLDCDLVHEVVVVNAGGTYSQTVTIKETGETASSDGKWTFDPVDCYVRFDQHFMQTLNRPDALNPDYAHPSGDSVMSVEYWLGHLIIRGSPDPWPGWRKID
jgi:hypothetical protein